VRRQTPTQPTHICGVQRWACLDVCILQTVMPIVAPPHLMRSTRNSQPSCVQAGLIWLPMLPEPPGRRNRQALQALDAFCQSGALPRRQLHWPSEQQLCTAFWHAPRQRRGARAHVRLDGEDAQAALAQPAQHAQHGRRVRAAVVGPEVVLHLGAGRSRRSPARQPGGLAAGGAARAPQPVQNSSRHAAAMRTGGAWALSLACGGLAELGPAQRAGSTVLQCERPWWHAPRGAPASA